MNEQHQQSLYSVKSIRAELLIEKRNRAIGSLLTAERSISYLEILLTLLRFRDNHELEPLHEDVLSALSDDATLFQQDIRQLREWELISERIEVERLRGYRDNRRRKFRYRLADETVAFLLWLQERYQDDQEHEDVDTRDLLSDMMGYLREAVRQINRIAAGAIDYEIARTLFHNLTRMTTTTRHVAQSLGTFNIRLLVFASGVYDVTDAKKLITELDRFLKNFLQRIHVLSREIQPEIAKLQHSRLNARWEACDTIVRSELAATGVIMRMHLPHPATDLAALAQFYASGGQLEKLTSRVNKSALMVWQKLHLHLRELERRSHRLEDLRARVKDLSRLPPNSVPHAWMLSIFQPAHALADMHEWTEELRATPPQPIWSKHRVRADTHLWLTPKTVNPTKPTQSIEERRLELLAAWMREHGIMPEEQQSVTLAAAHIEELNDFPRVMEVLRSGLLSNGRRLRRINLQAQPRDTTAVLTTDDAQLTFPDLTLTALKDGAPTPPSLHPERKVCRLSNNFCRVAQPPIKPAPR